MNARTLVDGVATAQVSADDRGLRYGDGLFETIAFVAGRAPLWSRHMQRLTEGCARLALAAPDTSMLAREAASVGAGTERSVVRITLTRGSGPRGYAPPAQAQPVRIVSASPMPEVAPDCYHRGVRMRRCDLRVSAQPRLAGIKHLNRLENVLARAEWSDPSIAEGLLCDAHGNVVGATAANVFAVLDGRLVTPALERCGVAGVARAQVLAWREDCAVRDLPMDELMRADEIFLTNAVRGIIPVASLDDRCWPLGPATCVLQRQWHELFVMERRA
ncbi:MAG: aminodeoxychorismate lyase [Proteobacteria bacterium]|nr:aminodeoxychorismate lyase [Pseudomonadota bacterium]